MNNKTSHKAILFKEMYCNKKSPKHNKINAMELAQDLVATSIINEQINQNLHSFKTELMTSIFEDMYKYTIRLKSKIKEAGQYTSVDYLVYSNVMKVYCYNLSYVDANEPTLIEIRELLDYFTDWSDLNLLIDDVLESFNNKKH